MAKKVTPEQREKILRLLTQGHDLYTIAAAVLEEQVADETTAPVLFCTGSGDAR